MRRTALALGRYFFALECPKFSITRFFTSFAPFPLSLVKMVFLSNEAFLSELAALVAASQASGTVHITQKAGAPREVASRWLLPQRPTCELAEFSSKLM
jgi:hypothetical protein